MKLTRLIFAAAATVALAVAGCGLLPLKPLVPIGCKDLKPECQCDEKGQNCKYVWICVPNK